MQTKTFGRYRKHRYHKQFEPHFWGMVALSTFAVLVIALLSRAELRLSGELLAAGSGDDLSILSEMQAFDEVQLVREREDFKLYVLRLKNKEEYLVTVVKSDDKWIVNKVEQLH